MKEECTVLFFETSTQSSLSTFLGNCTLSLNCTIKGLSFIVLVLVSFLSLLTVKLNIHGKKRKNTMDIQTTTPIGSQLKVMGSKQARRDLIDNYKSPYKPKPKGRHGTYRTNNWLFGP